MQNKAEIRRFMLSKRKVLGQAKIVELSNSITEILWPQIQGISNVAGYVPVHGEADAIQILARIKPPLVALPCVTKNSKILTFRQWKTGDALEPGMYEIHAPSENSPEMIPDIVLVPLLAFDKNCYRLGYGGAYYDMTIAKLKKNNPNMRAIGLAYDFQQVGSLPAETHDVQLDCVITENQIFNR